MTKLIEARLKEMLEQVQINTQFFKLNKFFISLKTYLDFQMAFW